MWKKAVLLGAAGFVIGALIGVIFKLLRAPVNWSQDILHFLIGGIWGAFAMSSSVVYDIEKWSVARATATHFLFVVVGYAVLSLAMGWFRIGDSLFWIILAVMVAVYFLIWLFMYLAYKRQIMKMNEELEKLKSAPKED